MQSYHDNLILQFDDQATGNAASGQLVTVFDAGLATKPAIFDTLGSPIANPLTTDIKGNFSFTIADGVYDIVGRAGTPDETRRDQVQIAVPSAAIIPRLNPDTLAIAIADPTLELNDVLHVKERSTGNGGGAIWDVFPAGTFTVGALIFDVFDHATLPLQLKLRIETIISIPQFGTSLAAIQAAVDKTGTSTTEINRGSLSLDTGITLNLSGTLEVDKKNLKLEGNNAIIQWTGAIGLDIFHTTDSSRCTFKDFAILGDLNAAPFAAFHFEAKSPAATLGTNENIVIENVIMGRRWGTDTTTGGSADLTPAGLLTNGIVIDGAIDGNNDEYTIRNVQVHSCTDFGINFANFQSIWSQVENSLANDCGTGMRFGCNMNLINPSFNRNTIADIVIFRAIEVRVLNVQSENLEKLVSSSQSASIYIVGGRFLRNDASTSNIIEFLNGGNLYMSGGIFFNNAGGGEDKISWRNGGSLPWTVDISQSEFLSGKRRSFFDIDSGTFGAIPPVININVEGFKLCTKQHYLDREFNVASVANDAQITTATGSSGILLNDLINVSYDDDALGVHVTPLITSDANARFAVTNLSGGVVDLATGRFRVLNLNDKVSGIAIQNITPSTILAGEGESLDITFPACKLGDMLVWSSAAGYINLLITAYVKSIGVATLRMHNATVSSTLPAQADLTIAIVKPIGQITSQISTGITVNDNAVATINIPNTQAKLGSHTFCSYSQDLKGLNVTSNVNVGGNIRITLSNRTGAGVTLTAGFFSAMSYA